jgi:hypothetical protein
VPDNGTWSGTVIHTENLGADSYVYLEMGTEEPVVVRLEGANSYKSGDTVHISPMADKIHRFDAAGKPIRGHQAHGGLKGRRRYQQLRHCPAKAVNPTCTETGRFPPCCAGMTQKLQQRMAGTGSPCQAVFQ